MPHVVRKEGNQTIRIHYQVHGHGEPIVFHHGLGNCLGDWQHLGYVDALQNDFQLILLDSRGFGESSKPHDPQMYTPGQRAQDNIAVLDNLRVTQAHCFGASVGANYCFFLAKDFPKRFLSYIFFTPGVPFAQLNNEFSAAMREGADVYLAFLEKKFGPFEKAFLRDTFLANDGVALWAANTSPWYDYHQYIKYIGKPSLLYTGGDEPINDELKVLAKQLPGCQFSEITGLGHVQAYWRADLAVPVIKDFIKKLRSKR